MTHARVIPILAIVSLVTGACAGEPDAVDPVAQEPVTTSLPAHEREPATTARGEGEPGDGEESGTELSLDADYDQVRNGARLMLSYDPTARAFTGTVENTTERTLRDVRRAQPQDARTTRQRRRRSWPGRQAATTPAGS